MSNRAYDFTLSASVGSSQRIDVAGNYFKVLTAPGGSVGVKIDGGPEIVCTAGQGLRIPNDRPGFRELVVRNLQAVAFSGSIFIGNSEFVDDTISGNVSIQDNAWVKTVLGQQFIASITRGATVGFFSIAGIRALTYNSHIKRLLISSTTAGNVALFACTGDPTVVPANTAGAGVNKVFRDGANSSAKALRGDAAAATPTGVELPGVFGLVSLYVAANTYTEVPLSTPGRLNINNGLVAVPTTANRDVTMLVDFEESAF